MKPAKLTKLGKLPSGVSAWAWGNYLVVQRKWSAPYAWTSYEVWRGVDGKRVWRDVSTLADVRAELPLLAEDDASSGKEAT